MHITHLSLERFRNYARLELNLPAGSILLHGDNAQGKTNLLEAIYYLATTRSPHADQDVQLIHWDAAEATEPIVVGRLVAQLQTTSGPRQIEMRLIRELRSGRNGFRREALVDRRKVRLIDLLGNLRVVLFLPEDIQIITGSPSGRRRYLDITLCQTDKVYCRALSAYNKVLEQRNALLRQIAEFGTGKDLLPVYTDKLVQLGSQIFVRRAEFVAALGRQAQRIHYEQLTDGQETLRISYLPRLQEASVTRGDVQAVRTAVQRGEWLAEQPELEPVSVRFRRLLADVADSELSSGNTRIGPHRDDWGFWVNGRQVRRYGSRGQQRSSLLALKLAEINWMTDQTGEMPLLLLDEVVAELDERRRELLLQTVGKVNQAILTATDPAMFSDAFLEAATTLTVIAGQIHHDNIQTADPG